MTVVVTEVEQQITSLRMDSCSKDSARHLDIHAFSVLGN